MLLEAPLHGPKRPKNSVLLTIDLTTAVTDEAIRRGDSLIVAYRTWAIDMSSARALDLCEMFIDGYHHDPNQIQSYFVASSRSP